MRHRWEQLTFLHWPYAADLVQRQLPPGLTVETWDDKAWVGLVPFAMRVGVRTGRGLPWLSRFWETNVRTYVRDEKGRPGIWFFSLDASRLGAVLAARAGYSLPYFWSRMSVDRDGETIAYTCRRRWPGPRGASSHAEVRIGARREFADVTPFEHWLTARWRLFSVSPRGRLRSALAEHQPWPLRHATASKVDDQLVAAAGLPQPTQEPLVHYSDGVAVRIGGITSR